MNANSAARILIADDHAVVRAGLRQFLEGESGIGEIGESATGAETLQRLRERSWDLLLLDINMPDRGGLDILRQVRAAHPGVRVLVLSGYPERQYAVHALRGGASGYLSKDSPPEELVRAVRTVLGGHRYVSAALAELLAADLDVGADSTQPLHSRLSEREFQILCKLAAGRSVTEIGAELCISVKTVSTYRSRIMEKMQFSTNADLTTYALRTGIMQ